MLVSCKIKTSRKLYILRLLKITWTKKLSVWLLLKSSSLHTHSRSSSTFWPGVDPCWFPQFYGNQSEFLRCFRNQKADFESPKCYLNMCHAHSTIFHLSCLQTLLLTCMYLDTQQVTLTVSYSITFCLTPVHMSKVIMFYFHVYNYIC